MMTTVQPGLTVKSLAEVAWLVSRVGRPMIEAQVEPRPAELQNFWQCTRQLQRCWEDALGDDPFATRERLSRFQELTAQLFTTELLVRVWATILGSLDQRTGRQDLTRIAASSVSGLLQIRNRWAALLLSPAAPGGSWAADLDRLRRRCDRWTDLLIGTICGRDEYFQFAFDPERARDFAEEAREGEASARPVELLVAAGVRLSFLGQLPDVALDFPAFEPMIQSILGSIPEQVFHRNGSLRSQLPDSQNTAQEPANPDRDVLLPGISLQNLRRRYS